MRPNELIPQILVDELLRLYRLDPNWCYLRDTDPPPRKAGSRYQVKPKYDTWLKRISSNAASWSSNWAMSWWLGLGPKVFVPTNDQARALENVEVRLSLEEFTSPYPSLLVDLRCLGFDPITTVTVTKLPDHMVCCLMSERHLHDITSTIAQTQGIIEDSLVYYDDEVIETEDTDVTTRATRVAINSCLALSHFGNRMDYLFPKEVENDKALTQGKLARDNPKRAEKAKRRLKLAVRLVSFSQETRLHRTERAKVCVGGGGLEQLEPRWRRGHWAMQPIAHQC